MVRKFAVIKKGEHGSLLFVGKRVCTLPSYPTVNVIDPTGAGDCFAGGFIGYLAGRGLDLSESKLDFAELRRAVIYGSVMGSFCCEKFGVDRFRTLTRQEIDARYTEFQDCTGF
jgi:sugar/nucleoside kinase (ribokinase family)